MKTKRKYVGRPANWFQLHAMDGRFLGVFLTFKDAEAWIGRRPIGSAYRLNLWIGETVNHRWIVRSGSVQWQSLSGANHGKGA